MIFKQIENYFVNQCQESEDTLEAWKNYFRTFYTLFFLSSTSLCIEHYLNFRLFEEKTWHYGFIFLSDQTSYAFIISIFVAHVMSWVSVVIRPLLVWSRVLFFITGLLVLMVYNSTNEPVHSSVTWIYASLFLSMINIKSSVLKKLFLFKSSQFITLYVYFMIGLWKLRETIQVLILEQDTERFINFLPSSIALRMLDKQMLFPPGLWVIGLDEVVHVLGWFSIVAIQCCALFFIFKDKYLKVVAVILILFHFATHVVMKVSFGPSLFLLAILFFLTPFKSKPIGELGRSSA